MKEQDEKQREWCTESSPGRTKTWNQSGERLEFSLLFFFFLSSWNFSIQTFYFEMYWNFQIESVGFPVGLSNHWARCSVTSWFVWRHPDWTISDCWSHWSICFIYKKYSAEMIDIKLDQLRCLFFFYVTMCSVLFQCQKSCLYSNYCDALFF